MSAYPYSRSEECSWQPEDVARHIQALISDNDQANLVNEGLKQRNVAALRRMFGSNRMPGDSDDDDFAPKSRCGCLKPILSALVGQLKETLILMLLGSAGLSLLLGNVADALSIAIALLIVGLVAAVQEYRSEAALEKLADLVPPTCTAVRDAQALDGFGAKDLVVGDLILLSTGE